jgi:uncharacterized protein
MNLQDQISEDLKSALKAKDKVKLEAIRAAKTAFTLAISEKGAGSSLSDEEGVKIIQKLVKQRKESAAIYKKENRQDLYEKEIEEAEALEKYLPEQMSEQELEMILRGIISETGASGMKDMGKVMGLATKKLAGRADGRMIAERVKQLLS